MNKVIKNYAYNIIYQVLVSIIPLIATPYVVRVLGADNIGAYSYTQSVTTYFTLIGCIGLNMYGQRAIAAVQDDIEKRSSVFKELMIIRCISITITFVAYVFLLVGNSRYGRFYLFHSLTIIAAMVDISWFFQGLENFRITVIRNLFVKFGGLVLIFLLVKSRDDVYIYTVINTAAVLVGNATLWARIKKEVCSVHISLQDIKKHIKPVFTLFLPQIAASIYVVLDKVMLGLMTGIDSEVAYYEEAQKLIKMLMAVVTSLGIVMMPRITFLFEKKDTELINNYMQKSIGFVLMLAVPMTFGISVCSFGFVPWFFGSGFEKVIPNMIIISPIIIWIGLSTIIGTQYFVATRRQKEYTLSIVIGCLINLVLNFLLIPKHLSYGAAIATCISELIVVIYQVSKTRKEFSYINIVRSVIKYFASSLIMACVIAISYRFLKVSIISTFIQVICGVIVYIVILVWLKEDNMKMVIDKIKPMFIKKEK